MVVSESVYLSLGKEAPDFILFDVVTKKTWSRDDIADGTKPFLVIFMCNHCPYVKHVEEEIANIGKTYTDQVAMAAISANDVSMYPDDSPDNLAKQAERLGFNFPYFYDDRQNVAISFKAHCTPDFYLFDKDLKLAYHGQLDDSRPSNDIEPSGKDLREAIDALLLDKEVSKDQKASVGCSIKWKPGNEPGYFNEF